jgi:cysteinyl-tRNA synthetase
MSIGLLGEHFDFHGGGQDLLFPHHENERAQSCACTGHAFVNFWLHNGLLYLGDKKMSKSDGNFFAMADVLAKIRPEVLRFFLLNAHFRSQIDYSEERLQEAAAALERLIRGTARLVAALDSDVAPVPEGLISAPGETLAKSVRDARRRFFAAMDDDFNSGGAIGVLFGLVRDLNQYFATAGEKVLDRGVLEEARQLLTEADAILVLLPGGVEGCAAQADAVPADILALVDERVAARKAREWARADALRATLLEQGWLVEDSAAGSTVRRGG